eukprot:9361890-Pyramimonas_sp.AAC.1
MSKQLPQMGPPAELSAFTQRCFGGWLQSQIQCTHCGDASASFEPFNDLSLDIRCVMATLVPAPGTSSCPSSDWSPPR